MAMKRFLFYTNYHDVKLFGDGVIMAMWEQSEGYAEILLFITLTDIYDK